MAKGDDAIRKKQNKANRKRMGKEGKVSARIASIIAAKKRRQSGKRRICQGMCFSLPTPENPFNDRFEGKDVIGKSKKDVHQKSNKRKPSIKHDSKPRAVNPHHGGNVETRESEKRVTLSCEKLTSFSSGKDENLLGELGEQKSFDFPSKFLVLCLKAIQNTWVSDDTFHKQGDEVLLSNAWGVEFWKHYSMGSNIIDTSGLCSNREQVAWLVSTSSDVVARKEKEGLSISTPFLLFLVQSNEKAAQVRSVCKPLKAFGIHTMSLHSGASVDHLVQRLKSREPEFLVSTPQKLSEILSLGAIDISGISLLVIDGLYNLVNSSVGIENLKHIKQSISGKPQIVIFNDNIVHDRSFVKHLIEGTIWRLSSNMTITSMSAYISQCVHAFSSEEEKMSKGIQIVEEICHNWSKPHIPALLLIADTVAKAQLLVTSLEAEGYSTSYDTFCDSHGATREKRIAVSVTEIAHAQNIKEIRDLEIVIFINLPTSIDDYVGILTSMARHSVNGVLHSFFGQNDAPLACPLRQVLEQCGQRVPQTLRSHAVSTPP